MDSHLVDSDQYQPLGGSEASRDSQLMRRANNEVRRQSDTLDPSEAVAFFCECATAGCFAPVFLSSADFDAVLAAKSDWVLKEGHGPSTGGTA